MEGYIIDNLDRWIDSGTKRKYFFSNEARINTNYNCKGGIGLEGSSPKAIWVKKDHLLQLEYHLFVQGDVREMEMRYDYAKELTKKMKFWLRQNGARKEDFILIIEPMAKKAQRGGGNKYDVQLYWKTEDCPSNDWMHQFEKSFYIN